MTWRPDTAAPAQVRTDESISQNNIRSLIADNYFAATHPSMICDALSEKIDDWIAYTDGTAHFRRIEKAYSMYYGFTQYGGANSSQVIQSGPQGQYSLVFINEFRNVIKHVLNMVVSQKLSFDCHGANTNVETTEACEIGNRVLEDATKRLKMDNALRMATEYACALSEGYVIPEWDQSIGKPHIRDANGNQRFQGDVSIDYFAPWDIIKDHWRRDELLPWVMAIRWKNKFDLMAKYPDKADRILAADPAGLWLYRQQFFNTNLYGDQCDLVPEISFYHEKSPALPEGRLVRFIDKNCKLFDGPLPYEKVPAIRIAPDHLAETCHGYSFSFDLLGVQDLTNLADSITATIFKTLGVGIVKLPVGHNSQYQQLAEGLAALVVNETNGRAEAMNFAKLPDGLAQYRQWLSSRQDILGGINSVIKGQPDANIKAGNFAALIAAQAYQFMNQLQHSYTTAAKELGQAVMSYYQKFPTTDRLIETVGENKKYAVSSFQKDQLKPVQSVTVDIGNSATRNPAARMQMAEDLLASGKLQSAEQFLKVMETGNLDHVTQRSDTQEDGINRENEMLRKGQQVQVLVTDDPFKHVHCHLMIVDDPEARAQQPEVIAATMRHIQEHIDMWNSVSQSNPSLLQLMNIAPAQMMMQQPPMPGEPGPADQAEPMQIPQEPSPMGPPGPMQDTKLPPLPNNPLTNEPPPIPTGPLG
jgi:hypothetical protein